MENIFARYVGWAWGKCDSIRKAMVERKVNAEMILKFSPDQPNVEYMRCCVLSTLLGAPVVLANVLFSPNAKTM